MALITRMTRLFTADLHAVLDRLEDPDILLKQAIREMEDDLSLREQRIHFLDHEREQSARQAAQIDHDLVQLDEQLDVCMTSAEEDLARTLLKRKLEMTQLSKRLRARADANTEALVEERGQLDENREAFDALRERAESMLDAPNGPGGRHAMGAYQTTITDADVEVALLQEKQRRSRP